jgi:hypothetical protein
MSRQTNTLERSNRSEYIGKCKSDWGLGELQLSGLAGINIERESGYA